MVFKTVVTEVALGAVRSISDPWTRSSCMWITAVH